MFSIETIRNEIKESKDLYRDIREQFHRIPELAMEEVETTDLICRYLNKWGIKPVPMDPTGVCAYIGPLQGPVLALRADIDGLAVEEDTGLACTSIHKGKMHACGHDGHIAGLLGAAKILKEHEGDLPYRIKLIFQPAEENASGAACLIGQGVLEDVDAIFGLHLFSDIPTGTINIQEGPRMAQTDRFTMTFYGKGGHAAKPHLAIDSTVMAAEFVVGAQTVVSRLVNPVENAVITIGSLHSGTQYNIISPQAVLSGTCRSFSVDTAKKIQESLEKRARSIADYYGGKVDIDYVFGSHPPLINHDTWSQVIGDQAKDMLTDDEFTRMPPMMLGEDFSWYQVHVPGVFAFVGCGSETGIQYANHHPKFDIDEKALSDAVTLHIAACMAFEKFLGADKNNN